jgi:hypothetical protein
MNDFATLAQYGRSVTAPVSVDVREAALVVEGGGAAAADPARFELLFTRAFEFALDNGASRVAVECDEGGVTITGDGDPPQGDTERYFDYGDAVANTTSGTALPMVRMLTQVHGWDVWIDPDYEDGVRLVVSWAAPRIE